MHCFLASTGSVNSRCLGKHNEAVMALLQPAEKEGTLHVLPALGFPESRLFSAAHPQSPGRSIEADDRGDSHSDKSHGLRVLPADFLQTNEGPPDAKLGMGR